MPPGAIGYQTFSVLLFWQPSPHPHDFKKATPPFSVAYEIQAAIRQEERKKKDKGQAAQSLFLFIKRTTALPEALPGDFWLQSLARAGSHGQTHY